MSGSNAQNAVHLVNKYIYLIIGLIWGVSFSTALVGYFFAGYAWTGTWCWFPEQALYPRYFLTHGPRILIFLIIIVTYTSLFIKLKREVTSKGSEKREIKSFESTHETSSQVNKTVNKMLIFPAIYVLLWSGGMVNRLLDATTGATDISRFLQGFTQFIPFADSILYAAVIGLKKIKIGDSTTNEFKSSQA
ncbi:hypothetical protein HK099_001126 [Clydaea vesicula]|uniref:Glucose receptor Git3-like N-terminal domain-containing protein n=1 Tax=Clydaea vesicula TaxID=447962 RepID=A0AAD5UAU6_9FUNG|nr:hypothetical protein HK099_001126 [Clydaea vesicula]